MENARVMQIVPPETPLSQSPLDLDACFSLLGFNGQEQSLPSQLPFHGEDISAGSETELQAVVIGKSNQVDLPLTIEQSRYFANLQRRTRSGETPPRLLEELQEFLSNSSRQAWENSWVRFPRRRLCHYAERVLQRDLLADKEHPELGKRHDLKRFQLAGPKGEAWLRLPVSYLLKLALADLLGNQQSGLGELHQVGESLLEHYLNDNSSPETFSFHVARLRPQTGMGRALAKETAKRFLFSQLLISYANQQFGLLESGQEARVYFAPHPPRRQKRLNELVPDAYYRHLFMSPCLSGWSRGENKHSYMRLCHEVLSRSQLNAVAKLREAGIITNNLVVLPNVSNTSLANNGVHISLGSQILTRACAAGEGFGPAQEKYLGDLTTKIMEHFLPLFVNSYSAAPYRLEFADFHPEKALGFLPHELDFTHLRMLWRRWKKKASLSVFGRPLTPFGPAWLDRPLSRCFGLRGDLIPDYRLIDYPVAFLSTEQSPAHSGQLGNQEQLKGDLADMGVFDRQMSLYQFFKLREYAGIGFSGFEGRHYSLFPDLEQDLGGATNLQALLCALTFKYMANGQVNHRHIPDTPFVESERRQIFFGMAIGIPTFFVSRTTRNRFLLKILKRTDRVRPSRRYPGYYRVYHQDYCQALLRLLREDAGDLIEMFHLDSQLEDLQQRISEPRRHSATAHLTRAINGGQEPMKQPAEDFNRAAETYYRGGLRRRHTEQALDFLAEDLRQLDLGIASLDQELRPLLQPIMEGRDPLPFLQAVRRDLLADQLGIQPLVRLLKLMLLCEKRDRRLNSFDQQKETHGTDTSVHRPLQRADLQ